MTEIGYQLFAAAHRAQEIDAMGDMMEIKSFHAAAPAGAQRSEREAVRDDALMRKAREFEAVFVAQMLQQSGLSEAFSGDSGFGGEAFASMLTEQYANEIVDSGGFGLAEHIYKQLVDKENAS